MFFSATMVWGIFLGFYLFCVQIKLPQLCLHMKRGWPNVHNSGVLKNSVLSSTLSTSLLVGDKFLQFSVSLCHTHTHTHTCTPFTTIDHMSPLWSRWRLPLAPFLHCLSHFCFSSWQSLSSRYFFLQAGNKLRCLFPIQAVVLTPDCTLESRTEPLKNANTCLSPFPNQLSQNR